MFSTANNTKSLLNRHDLLPWHEYKGQKKHNDETSQKIHYLQYPKGNFQLLFEQWPPDDLLI